MATDPKYNTLVKRRHPEYEDRLEHWDFLESCYEGGRDWFEPNIFRYLKEGDGEFKDRVARAYRFNHSREVVDLLDKYLFRADTVRNTTDAPDSVQKFWLTSTRAGAPVNSLIKRVSKNSSIFGRHYVVVDTNVQSSALSVADAVALNARTYAYLVKPQDALDMSFDEHGDLNWILIREYARDDLDPFGDDADTHHRYRLWTKTSWALYRETAPDTPSGDVKIEAVASGDHNLGIVPVIPVDHIEDENLYFTPALINDIAYLDRAVANYLSNLDAIIQDQAFSQLALPAQALPPGEEGDMKDKLIEMGTRRIFIFNGEGGMAPQFLSPDPRQAELIITAIRTIIAEIYHTVGMAGERTKQDNSMGIDNSSGVAKAYDFDRVNALLVAKAEMLERFERRLIKVVAKWNDDDLDEETLSKLVVYARNFDVRGLLDEFEVASRLSLIQAPDILRREQMKTLSNKLLPVVSEETQKEVDAELEKWPESARELTLEMNEPQNTTDDVDTPKRPTQGSVQDDE